MAELFPRTPAETVGLTRRLDAWLTRLGVPSSEHRTNLVVGLSDILSASHHVAVSLDRLLATDPTTAEGADAALTEVGAMYAWLGTEMRDHLDEVLAAWEPALEQPVADRLPPDTEEEVT